MLNVKIFWDPKGSELDVLGTKKYLRATEGDIPYGNKRRSDRFLNKKQSLSLLQQKRNNILKEN